MTSHVKGVFKPIVVVAQRVPTLWSRLVEAHNNYPHLMGAVYGAVVVLAIDLLMHVV